MNIARILYPIEVLGPGKRIGIWTAGCPRRCHGCSNPELWEKQDKYEILIASLLVLVDKILCNKEVNGFVVTGGDPFFQPEELNILLPELKRRVPDILVYTGYTYTELIEMKNPTVISCLKNIDVLIDGPYIEDENDGCRMRGSRNQSIYYMNEKLQDIYEHYINSGTNQIQNFTTANGIVSVGIHHRGFEKELKERAIKKGVLIDGKRG